MSNLNSACKELEAGAFPSDRVQPDSSDSDTAGCKIEGLRKELHMTLTRLGKRDVDYSQEQVLYYFKLLANCGKSIELKVIDHGQFGPNFVAIVDFMDKDKEIQRYINLIHLRFGKKERDGKFYASEERKFHVSFFKEEERNQTLSIGKIIRISSIFIKKEGPFDPHFTFECQL